MRRSEAEPIADAPDMPSLDALSSRPPTRTIRGRNRTKADILVYRGARSSVALKTYRARPWWIRHTLGRVLVAREAAAYRALDGIAGVARWLGRACPGSFAVELLPGRPLVEHASGSLPPTVFDRLDELLAEIHARGVALGDLHHRDVIVDGCAHVGIVDFATAVLAGPRAGRLRRRLVERMQLADRDAAARLRARYSTEPMTIDDRATARHRRARRFKRAWDALRGGRRDG